MLWLVCGDGIFGWVDCYVCYIGVCFCCVDWCVLGCVCWLFILCFVYWLLGLRWIFLDSCVWCWFVWWVLVVCFVSGIGLGGFFWIVILSCWWFRLLCIYCWWGCLVLVWNDGVLGFIVLVFGWWFVIGDCWGCSGCFGLFVWVLCLYGLVGFGWVCGYLDYVVVGCWRLWFRVGCYCIGLVFWLCFLLRC